MSPTPPDRRARKREERIRAILETALDIVAREGLDALTTHRLARELDVAVGALYRYFPSKGALVAALEREVIGSYKGDVVAIAERARAFLAEQPACEDPTLVQIVLVARTYEHLALTHPERFRLINLILATPQTLLPSDEGAQVMAATAEVLAEVAAHVAEAQRDGALSPGHAMERTLLFWSSVRAVLQLYKLRSHAPELIDGPALLRSLVRTLLTGWGAAPARIEAAEALAEAAWEAVSP